MRVLRKIGEGCVLCLKAVAWLLMGILNIAIECIKIILLVFSLILRVFTSFVRAGTP